MKIFRDTELEKELEQVKDLKKVILESPMTQQIMAEKASEILKRRQKAAQKIELLKKQREELIPKLREAVQEKERKYLEIKTALAAANEEIQRARVALSRETTNFDTDIRLEEQTLLETYDSLIDKTITFFRERLDYLRSPGRISIDKRGSERNIFTETKKVVVESNEPAILSAVEYCMAGIKELEGMKMTPELNLQKIEQLKAGMPKIDIYSEFTGEKPFPKINTAPPRKSDSHWAYELSKLDEKFQKIMGRASNKQEKKFSNSGKNAAYERR